MLNSKKFYVELPQEVLPKWEGERGLDSPDTGRAWWGDGRVEGSWILWGN